MGWIPELPDLEAAARLPDVLVHVLFSCSP